MATMILVTCFMAAGAPARTSRCDAPPVCCAASAASPRLSPRWDTTAAAILASDTTDLGVDFDSVSYTGTDTATE